MNNPILGPHGQPVGGSMEINIDKLPDTVATLARHGKTVEAVHLLGLCVQALTKLLKSQQATIDKLVTDLGPPAEQEKGN